MDPTRLALAALLSGLFALERKAFLQAMLSRPLVAGALLGLVLDRPAEGVAVGAALELFFLGSVNLGAALPDNELFTTVAAVACACALGPATQLPLAATLAFAVLVALPMAKLGRLSDRLCERVNARVASYVEHEADAHRLRTGLRQNLYGLWLPFVLTALVCVLGAIVGSLLLPGLVALGPAGLVRGLSMAWASFLLVAAAVAARSARTPHAFAWAGLAAFASAGLQSAGLWEPP